MQCLEDSELKDHLINESINQSVTEVIVEQPLAFPGSPKKEKYWLDKII